MASRGPGAVVSELGTGCAPRRARPDTRAIPHSPPFRALARSRSPPSRRGIIDASAVHFGKSPAGVIAGFCCCRHRERDQENDRKIWGITTQPRTREATRVPRPCRRARAVCARRLWEQAGLLLGPVQPSELHQGTDRRRHKWRDQWVEDPAEDDSERCLQPGEPRPRETSRARPPPSPAR